MLGNLIGGFITILVGTTLVPVVADSVFDATHNATGGEGGVNVVGASATVVGLTTLFFVLGVTSAGIALATQGLRKAGVM